MSSTSTTSVEGSSEVNLGDEIRERTGQFLQKISDNIFASAGIKFIRIEIEHSKLVTQFLTDNFLPTDLISKSYGIIEDDSLDSMVENFIKDEICVMATDKEGDLIGVYLAGIYRRGDWLKKLSSDISVDSIFDRGNAAEAHNVNEKLLKLLGYNVWGMFDGHDCQSIAGDILLCISTKSPVPGIGTELVRHGEIAAKEKHCDLAVCATTDSHVQRVLRDCGYVLRSVVVLCDFKDEDGRLFIKAADEDSSARVLLKNLKI